MASTTKSAEAELRLLDTEISRLGNVLTTLQRRQYELQQFVEERSSLRAPIRKLSMDLLEHIFVLCQQTSLEDNGFIEVCNPNTFVRVISRVSSYWRKVALRFPLLWSRITVDLHVKRARNISSVLKMIAPFLEKCIERSGEVPLTIAFSKTITPKLLGTCGLKEVAKCADRWRDVIIGWELLEAVGEYIPKEYTCSCLRSLSIFYEEPEPRSLVFQPQTPSLTEVIVRRVTNPSQCLPFPWSQITHFTSDNNTFNPSGLRELFTSMQNLVSLTFSGYAGASLRTQPIILAKLRTLKLSGDYDQIVDQLQVFVAPELKNLQLDCGTSFVGDVYTHVLSFLERSQFTLETLVLRGIPLYQGWDDEELIHVKRLEVHRISDLRYSDDLLWLTRFEDPYVILFPKLETLELNFEPDIDGEMVVWGLIDMMKSRLPPTSRVQGEALLRTIAFNFTRELNPEHAGWLRDFLHSREVLEAQKMGVSITIRHGLVINGRRQEGRILY